MKRVVKSFGLVSLLVAPVLLQAQTPAAVERESSRGVSLEQVIESVAKKTAKKFIVDPRVRGDVLVIGSSATNGDYAQLLSVLEVHGFAAVDSGGFVQVVPAASVRQLPVPTVTSGKQFGDGEVVTRVIAVKSIPAPQLIPMLRPLLPQVAHLAAFPCTNTILMVDRYANVKRIEGVIEAMDTGETFKPRECSVEEPKK